MAFGEALEGYALLPELEHPMFDPALIPPRNLVAS
jgi:hypothetical protein